jgi:hypothetical protein
VACPLPVDDSAAAAWPSLGSPWTHPPECEPSIDRTAKYCTYTNSRHGSRGWSVVTTPETAANSASFLNLRLNTTAASRAGAGGSQDAPYKLVDMAGKGMGLVATRPIKQYDEIVLDYATVMVDLMFTTKVSAFIGYRLLHAAVEQLADPASVLELDQTNEHAQDTVENILRTNAFNTQLGGVPHLAVYPTVSVRVDRLGLFPCWQS